MWCVCHGGAVEEMMCMSVTKRGHSGDGCDLALSLCKYVLRNTHLRVVVRQHLIGSHVLTRSPLL